MTQTCSLHSLVYSQIIYSLNKFSICSSTLWTDMLFCVNLRLLDDVVVTEPFYNMLFIYEFLELLISLRFSIYFSSFHVWITDSILHIWVCWSWNVVKCQMIVKYSENFLSSQISFEKFKNSIRLPRTCWTFPFAILQRDMKTKGKKTQEDF